MNRMPLLLTGIFLTFLTSWIGLVAMPYLQIGHYKPEVDDVSGESLPPAFSGEANQGAVVYASNGCIYCHSQQVRPLEAGSDLERGWGTRRTVARDYMYDKVAYFGTMRTGPDLSNIGARQPSLEWHYQHLYQPQVVSPGSIMPPFRFLFEKRRIVGQPSNDAVKLLPPDQPEAGWEIVPTAEARSLVQYLTSLKRSSYPLPEAPEETPAK
jgi:cytochrome c oxidase cbb3-type subunit 2